MNIKNVNFILRNEIAAGAGEFRFGLQWSCILQTTSRILKFEKR